MTVDEAVRDQVARLMDELLRVQPEVPDLRWIPQLAVDADGPIPDVCEAVHRWLADPAAPSVGLLRGPVGAGKTLTACRITRAIAERKKRRVVYASLGTARAAPDPHLMIGRSLGLRPNVPLWRGRARLDLLILDGTDEVLAQRGEGWVCHWFRRLFADTQFHSTRLLVCGRDEAIGEGAIFTRFVALLGERVRARSKGMAREPFEIRLKPWSAANHRLVLDDLLRPGEVLEDLIRLRLIESQLLFGLVYSRLANRRHRSGARVESEWHLMEDFIEAIIIDCTARYAPHSTTPLQDRKRIPQNLSSFLALSGRGMAGISESELRRDAFHWIWERLQ